MAKRNHSQRSIAAIFVLALCFSACAAQPQSGDEGSAPSPSSPSARAMSLPGPPVTMTLEMEAAPGSSTGVLKISVEFQRAVEGASITLYPPQALDLEDTEAVFAMYESTTYDKGEAVTLWEGDSEASIPYEFVFPTSISEEQIIQAGLRVAFRVPSITGEWTPTKGLYYFTAGNEVFATDSHITTRRLQLQQELKLKGFEGLSQAEIYERDPDLYWDLEYPFEKPKPDTLTVVAPDGTPVEYVALPRHLLDAVPDSLKMRYNNPDWALERHHRQKMRSQKIRFPKGFHFSDLPDSLSVIEDDPTWTREQREAAHEQYRERIRAWLKTHWPAVYRQRLERQRQERQQQ